jgi:hypothetical protein
VTASLLTANRRSLDDFIPRWFRVTTYSLAAIHLATWFTIGVLRLYSTPEFGGRFITLIVFSGIFSFFTRVSVNRSPIAMDRIFGPRYRRGEVRHAFALEICTAVMLALRLYQEVADTVARPRPRLARRSRLVDCRRRRQIRNVFEALAGSRRAGSEPADIAVINSAVDRSRDPALFITWVS